MMSDIPRLIKHCLNPEWNQWSHKRVKETLKNKLLTFLNNLFF